MEKVEIYDESCEELEIAMLIGLNLLKSGADISRVESTIKYVLESYGARDINVFSIPSLIITSCVVDSRGYVTKIKRNRSISVDLFRIEKYNSLSRLIAKNKPGYDEVFEQIKAIQERKDYSSIILILGGIIASFGFSIFFGGTIKDGIAAGIIGGIMVLFNFFKPKNQKQNIHVLIASIIGGLLSLLSCLIHLADNLSYVIIGAIMINIPGIMIMTSIRDMMVDDIVSGSIKLLQSLFIALAITAGFSIFAKLYGGDINLYNVSTIPFFIIGAICGTLGFSIYFNSKYKRLPFAILCGVVTTLVYLLFVRVIEANVFVSNFISAFVAAVFSEVMARIIKAPASSFLLPGIIPLVPGSLLFYSIYNLINHNYQLFSNYLVEMLLSIIAISLGLVLSTVIFENIPKRIKSIKEKKA